MQGFLFIVLLGLGGAALAALKCEVYSATTRMPFNHYLKEIFHGQEITGRDGKVYKLKARTEGSKVTIGLFDSANTDAGDISFTVSDNGKRIILDSAYLAIQGQGLTSQILKQVHTAAPPGAKLSLESRNDETNEPLQRLQDRITRRPAYRIIASDRPQAEQYLRRALTAAVRRQYEEDKDSSPLWYRALAGTGWVNIRVAPSTTHRTEYSFSGEKPVE